MPNHKERREPLQLIPGNISGFMGVSTAIVGLHVDTRLHDLPYFFMIFIKL